MSKPIACLAALLIAAPVAARPADAPSTVQVLERLAASGDAEATYHLGMAYQTGTGVSRDPAKALAAFRRAAAAGDPLGAYKLGCYYAGQGGDLVKVDPQAALRHKLVAAEAGYALAQYDVAAHYAREGRSAPALAWLQRSAAQGWAPAFLQLASLYGGAGGFAEDPVKMVVNLRLFVKSAGVDRGEPAWLPAMTAALTQSEAKLTPAQRVAVLADVAGYRAAPTPLTIKALSGVRAAEAVVAQARR